MVTRRLTLTGVLIAVFGLIKGVQGGKQLFLPIQISLSVMFSEIHTKKKKTPPTLF